MHDIDSLIASSNPAQARCTRYNVCQRRAAGLWCSLGTPVSSTNKIDRHDIAEILLKVALNTITLTLDSFKNMYGGNYIM